METYSPEHVRQWAAYSKYICEKNAERNKKARLILAAYAQDIQEKNLQMTKINNAGIFLHENHTNNIKTKAMIRVETKAFFDSNARIEKKIYLFGILILKKTTYEMERPVGRCFEFPTFI
jgi:hypothetical protein